METIGLEYGSNAVIGILAILGMTVVVIMTVLHKLGWIRIGKAEDRGGVCQMSIKELVKVINEDFQMKVNKCSMYEPMMKSHEKLMAEVADIHNQQIKNMSLHERSTEKLNEMNQEFFNIKLLLSSIDKKVCILTCMMNKDKFFNNNTKKCLDEHLSK